MGIYLMPGPVPAISHTPHLTLQKTTGVGHDPHFTDKRNKRIRGLYQLAHQNHLSNTVFTKG